MVEKHIILRKLNLNLNNSKYLLYYIKMNETTKLVEFAIVFESTVPFEEELDESEKGVFYTKMMSDGIEYRLELSKWLKKEAFLASEVPFLLGPTPHLVLFAVCTENGAKRLENAPGVIAVARSLRSQEKEGEKEKGLIRKIKDFVKRRKKEK